MFGLQMVNEMESFQREIDQLFRGCGFVPARQPVRQSARQSERLKLRDADDLYVVETPLPGIDAEKLDISVLGRRLTLAGELVDSEIPEEVTWHLQERERSKFRQTMLLPLDVDSEDVKAEYRDGILRISLKKVATAVPKKIAVKAA